MKTMNIGHLVYGVLTFALSLTATLQAQPLARGGGAVSSGSIVQCGAGTFDLTQLPIIESSNCPAGGSYFLASGGPPYPCLPSLFNPGVDDADGTAPTVYVIDPARHAYLVDNRAALALKLLVQTLDDPIPIPGGGGGGSGTNGSGTNTYYYFAPMYTNGLWLAVSNVGAETASFQLHGATDEVYAVWTATNVPGTWNVEAEVWPTNTDVMPFTLPTLDRQTLFVRAEDWTGVTENGNTTPDWWLWKYFGTVALSDTNLDSGGVNTLLYDYEQGLDPNVITFSIQVANNYVNTSNPGLQLNVTAGTPRFYSVLVDSTNSAMTNFTTTNWTAYTSPSITANLGTTEGWHEIWVSLRGLPLDAQQTLAWQRLKLDFTPPELVISGPTNSTVTTPLIQLTGYSPEALSSISYDISNAVGTVTGQTAVITGQFYSTNTAEFTTNYFRCYDVPLANGLNLITLHAMDLAGNMATLATNILCSAPTNPPAVAVLWPQDGMQLSGGSFSLEGQVDDPTATVSLAGVDADGNTNYFSGLTGRDGMFWVENVPLSPGTNSFALTVSDSGGDTLTNFTLVQTTIGLSINAVQAGDTNASGTLDTNGYTIWVEGNQAAQSDGTWNAPIAPLGIAGGVVLVTAIPNTDNGGNGTGGGPGVNPTSPQGVSVQATVDAPQGVFVSAYHRSEQWDYSDGFPTTDSLHWQDGQGGSEAGSGIMGSEPGSFDTIWPATSWPQGLTSGTETLILVSNSTNVSTVSPPTLALEHCDINLIATYGHCRHTADTEMKLATGGPLGSRQMNLWCLSASATDVDTGLPIPPEEIEIGGFWQQDTNAELWVLLPDNDPDVVTPKVKWKKHYSFGVTVNEYIPQIVANDLALSDKYVWQGRDFCVGEGIYFNVAGLPARVYEAVAVWSLPGTFVNRQPDPNCLAYYDQDATLLTRSSVTNGALTTYACYVKDLQPATVSLELRYRFSKTLPWHTNTLSGMFNVHRPTTTFIPPSSLDGTPTVRVTSGVLTLGWNRIQDMSFGHQINPGGFAGQAGYTQLVGDGGDEIQTYKNSIVLIQPNNDLDNQEFPFGQSTVSTNANTPVQYYDQPLVNLANNYSTTFEKLHFHNYLLFKPDDGPGPNIFVPLRKVDWSLDDEATYGSTGWTPTGSASQPSDADSSSFPHWIGIIYNSQFTW